MGILRRLSTLWPWGGARELQDKRSAKSFKPTIRPPPTFKQLSRATPEPSGPSRKVRAHAGTETDEALYPLTPQSNLSSNSPDYNATDNTIIEQDEAAELKGEYVLDFDAQDKKIKAEVESLKEMGWPDEVAGVYYKISMRGYEPLLPNEWAKDFPGYPTGLFTDREKAYVVPLGGSDFRAVQAFKKLSQLGPDFRDAVATESTGTPGRRRPAPFLKNTVETRQILPLQNQPTPLSTIGENTVTSPPRKKRRSSLSDLKQLPSGTNSPAWNSPVRFDGTPQRAGRQPTSSPQPASPTRSNIPTPSHGHSSVGRAAAMRVSPNRKENTSPSATSTMPRPLNIKPRHSIPQPTINTASEAPHSTPAKRRSGATTPSGIPSLKLPTSGGLSERPTAGNATRLPAPSGEKPASSPSPKRLRMQSPQKLRERMAAEQKAINAASNALQSELAKIGDEIGSLPAGRSPQKAAAGPGTTSAVAGLSTRLNAVSAQVTTQFAALNARVGALSTDIASSLAVSEARAKKLDELYRDANAENEALYARFNEELAKMVKAIRAGEGAEEVKRRLRESSEEAERLRRENMRLKREVVGLRAQLKE